MKLAHILVCHSTNPRKAIESIPHYSGAIWYVFLHSNNYAVASCIEELMLARDGNVFDFCTNRGLARSWNDGLHLSMEAGCDAAILLNDDLFFYGGGYQDFVHTISAVKSLSDNVCYITPLGRETGPSGETGKIQAQHFACCAITSECVKRVGYFDECYFPAYYEDVDYDHRTRLAGMSVHVHQSLIVEHERSQTQRGMDPIERKFLDQRFTQNKRYFEAKWGPNSSLTSPFGRSELSYYIPFADRRNPYPSIRTTLSTEKQEGHLSSID